MTFAGSRSRSQRRKHLASAARSGRVHAPSSPAAPERLAQAGKTFALGLSAGLSSGPSEPEASPCADANAAEDALAAQEPSAQESSALTVRCILRTGPFIMVSTVFCAAATQDTRRSFPSFLQPGQTDIYIDLNPYGYFLCGPHNNT